MWFQETKSRCCCLSTGWENLSKQKLLDRNNSYIVSLPTIALSPTVIMTLDQSATHTSSVNILIYIYKRDPWTVKQNPFCWTKLNPLKTSNVQTAKVRRESKVGHRLKLSRISWICFTNSSLKFTISSAHFWIKGTLHAVKQKKSHCSQPESKRGGLEQLFDTSAWVPTSQPFLNCLAETNQLCLGALSCYLHNTKLTNWPFNVAREPFDFTLHCTLAFLTTSQCDWRDQIQAVHFGSIRTSV